MSMIYKGRLTQDPELRFTQGGTAVANFNFVTSTRTFDRQSNEWKDDNVTFYSCEVWGSLGEWVAENLRKGNGVFLEGDTRTEQYTDAQGNKRSALKMKVYDINLSAKMNPKQFNLTSDRQQGGGQGGYSQNNAPAGNAPASNAPANNGGNWNAPQPDPWASPSGSGGQGGWESTQQDEPPF